MHKFKAGQTIFYYDNSLNCLLDKDKNLLSKPTDLPADYIQYCQDRNADSKKKIKKSNSPIMIKITLGQKCNYSCNYCSQRELGDLGSPEVMKMKREFEIAAVGNLITDMKKYLDFGHLQRFELWGGETVLYMTEIQMIMEAFDRENLIWYIPTNGTLLKEHHIEYFNQRKGTVTLGISHDGYAHEITRGKDFLKDKVEIFRLMQQYSPKIQFSMNPVISKENFDLFKLDAFFNDFCKENNLKPFALSMELITLSLM